MSHFFEDPTFLASLKHYPDDQMFPAWAGCIDWASRKPEIVAAFERYTGVKLNREDRGLMLAFTEWATENVWGDENATDETD